MDEDLTRHVEQGDGESHTLPHEEQHEQENHLQGLTVEKLSLMIKEGFFSPPTSEKTCYNSRFLCF